LLRPIGGAARVVGADLARVAEMVRDRGLAVDEIALRRPTLDDAFLALTGHRATSDDSDSEPVGEEVAA
jgi:hypothetical protein